MNSQKLDKIKCPKCNAKIKWNPTEDSNVFGGSCSNCGMGFKYLNGTIVSDIKFSKKQGN